MAPFFKNIGFVTFPELGIHSPHSGVMETPHAMVPQRYQTAGYKPVPWAHGAVLYNQNANKDKGLAAKKHRFTGFVDTNSKLALHANQGHETQHSVFSKIKQIHGKEAAQRAASHALSVLHPLEHKLLSYININKEKYPETSHDEELISHFHNYLQDPFYRNQVHKKLDLSPSGIRSLHSTAKVAWQKIREHAKTFSLKPNNADGLAKREPPKFPKLGVSDSRKEVELINDPNKLKTKLSVMANQGIQNKVKQGFLDRDHTGKDVRRPYSAQTIEGHKLRAAKDVEQKVAAAVSGQATIGGAQSGSHGYALSGILRPNQWPHPQEDESQGTQQHEEFHAQMDRVGQKFGPMARRALADNLWNALGDDHRRAADYLQQHWAGDHYDKHNPSTATEEKIARVFNHLNSPTTRQTFHSAQDLKTHELPNGEIAPEGKYVIPGMNRLSDRTHFDNTLKDAHRTLLAAGEVADSNWLKNGHTNSEYLRPRPDNIQKAEGDYRGTHRAPTSDSGEPMHSITNTYPEDIYSPQAAQYYGHGVKYDGESIAPIHQARGNPNAKVKIYRAVPYTPTKDEQLSAVEEAKSNYLKRQRVPAGENPNGYYDRLHEESERLKTLPPEPVRPKISINQGDWVTPSLSYAHDHGKSALKGQYKIVTKTVPAKHVFTDGNSIHEWGYDPSIKKSEDQTAQNMLGIHGSVDKFKSAAEFLSGKKIEDKALRAALINSDGDVKIATLVAVGIEPTQKNIKALISVTNIKNLKKSDFGFSLNISSVRPESQELVDNIKSAIDNGNFKKLDLGGKHSHNTIVVDVDDQHKWLIKPETERQSPSAGIKESSASQSEREVAFWNIAEAIGLGSSIPEAHLGLIDGKQASIIKMLPLTWKSIADKKDESPNIGPIALKPYADSGQLFKWAVIDYVLGNTDRHSGNLMVSDESDGFKVSLIDHGTSFAGNSFGPGIDEETWVPYYLRAWAPNWSKLTLEQKLSRAPKLPSDKDVFHWVLGIDPTKIAAIMQRYGIESSAVLARLEKLKNCKENFGKFITELWLGARN